LATVPLTVVMNSARNIFCLPTWSIWGHKQEEKPVSYVQLVFCGSPCNYLPNVSTSDVDPHRLNADPDPEPNPAPH
jgi:hypothetical protein